LACLYCVGMCGQETGREGQTERARARARERKRERERDERERETRERERETRKRERVTPSLQGHKTNSLYQTKTIKEFGKIQLVLHGDIGETKWRK
jgi:hypothetical protein